jgi:hypothetical protein
MAEPQGPPRKTNTYNSFSTMASNNQREGVKPDEFFWLENIMRVAPHKLHSVPGPSSPVGFYPIPITHCPDDAPGVQSLDAVCCYQNTLWVFPSGTASSCCYIPPDLNFWCTSSLQSGTGSSPYPVSVPQDWYLWKPLQPTGPSCDLVDITATDAILPAPHTITSFITQGGQAGRSGKSDENSYFLQVSGDLGNPYAAYFGQSSGFTPLIDTYNCTHGGFGPWTKYGGFYWSQVFCTGANDIFLKYWSVPGGVEQPTVATISIGGVADPSSPLPGVNGTTQIIAEQATATDLWVLKKAPTDTNVKLCKLDKTALTLTTEYSITDGAWTDLGPRCFNFSVFSNSLIFLIAWDGTGPNSSTVFTVGWFKPASNTFLKMGSFTTTCSIPLSVTTSPSGTTTFWYRSNYFFVGSDAGNLLKLGPVVCPSNPNIPWENL